MESVTVKQEPVDLPESTENGPEYEPPDTQIGAEFVNIKVEVTDECSPQEESAVEAPSSSTKDDDDRTWQVPIENSTSLLPNNYVEVSIKVEPDTTSFQSGDTILQQSSTSSLFQLHDGFGINDLVCRICFKRFANSGNVQRHMQIHMKEKYNCSECPRHFFSQQQLEKHQARHKNERAFPCEQCDKSFKSTSNLMQHKRTHLSVKPYFCTLCHKTFAFKANLTKHQGKSRCKKPSDDPITCHICHKVFEKQFLLKSHLRRHNTDRPFGCDECTMMFKHKSTLIRHVQMHNGVRPYVCPYCDKSFTHSALLKPHVRVHTGEKPYQCPMCEKKFSHKHNMQRHVMRHSKIKHLVCEICHKQFPKESRLKYHMKTHVNEKHFSCHICPKKFSHKQNVIRHYMRKHPNSKYECSDTDASVALKIWDTMKSKYSDTPEEILG